MLSVSLEEDFFSSPSIVFFPEHKQSPESVNSTERKDFTHVLVVVVPEHVIETSELEPSTVLVKTGLLGAGFPFTVHVSVTVVPLLAGLKLTVIVVMLSEEI